MKNHLVLMLGLAFWQIGLAQPVNFTRHTIGSMSTSIRAHVADLDGDGDQDVITAQAIGGDLFWWESSGGANPTFTKNQFGSNFEQSNDWTAADVNGDGHLDIVSSSFTLGQVAWWKNDGNPDPTFSKQLLSGSISQAEKAIPVDIDNDMDMDIIVLGRGAGKVFIFKNDGNLNPSFSQSSLDIFAGSRGIAAGDINADGLMDIAVGESFERIKIFYGSNTASSGFTSTFVNGPRAEQVWIADMNSDGQQDILMLYRTNAGGSTDKVGYLKNSGGSNPTFTLEQISNYDNAFRIEPAFIDGNAAADVLGGSNWDDSFRWWENGGGSSPSFTNYLIDGPFSSAWTVTAGDMDNDGDQDVVASRGTVLYWYENDLLEPLEITCPGDVTIECDDPTDPAGTGTATSSGGCGNVTIAFTDNTVPGANFTEETITRTWTATDCAGNQSTCVQVITVEDSTAPDITYCPVNITIDCTEPTGIFAIGDFPEATDNCDTAPDFSTSNVVTPGACSTDRIITRTWTANDVSGNTSSCVQIITLEDTTPPSITCPPNQNEFFDASCQFDLPDYTGLATATDNCSNPSVSQSPDIGTTVIGNTTVTLTATDDSCNSSTCSFTVVLSDNTPPTAGCVNTTVQLDANGDGSQTAAAVESGSWDNCGTVNTVSLNPDIFGCADVGGNTVTLTVNDGNGNTATCTATVTVEDNIRPSISCPSDTVFPTDPGECEGTFTVPVATASDNCGVTVLRYRWREVDAMGNNITPSWSSWSTAVMQTLDVGYWKIQWQAKDASNNQRKCSFLVEIKDTELPVPACLDATVTFNGEPSLPVAIAELYDAANSTDNCGVVNLVSPTMNQLVDCAQLGTVIDVPVVVNDGNGNDGTCTATITVEGLPCGWMDNGGVACAGSSSDFDTGGSTFDLTVGTCAPEFPYTADASSFVFTELCGDGEIIAKVDNIAGGQGYAGVMARDSEAPGAAKVSIGTNTINRVRKEVRIQPNYPSFPQAVLAYDQFWVRITRTGPSFRAFASTDGVQWFQYIFQNIQMGSCIKVGLYAYNEKATSPITATFSNVSINGVPVAIGGGALDGGAPPALNLGDLGQEQTEQNLRDLNRAANISLYPNPAASQVTLEMGTYEGQAATIQVFNQVGQLMQQVQRDGVAYREVLDVTRLQDGMYMVVVKMGDTVVTERLVIARP